VADDTAAVAADEHHTAGGPAMGEALIIFRGVRGQVDG